MLGVAVILHRPLARIRVYNRAVQLRGTRPQKPGMLTRTWMRKRSLRQIRAYHLFVRVCISGVGGGAEQGGRINTGALKHVLNRAHLLERSLMRPARDRYLRAAQRRPRFERADSLQRFECRAGKEWLAHVSEGKIGGAFGGEHHHNTVVGRLDQIVTSLKYEFGVCEGKLRRSHIPTIIVLKIEILADKIT